jgi:hypothetical protein
VLVCRDNDLAREMSAFLAAMQLILEMNRCGAVLGEEFCEL